MSQFQSIFFRMNDVITPLPTKADKPKQLTAKAGKKRPAFYPTTTWLEHGGAKDKKIAKHLQG